MKLLSFTSYALAVIFACLTAAVYSDSNGQPGQAMPINGLMVLLGVVLTLIFALVGWLL
jgi:hypothetical protein